MLLLGLVLYVRLAEGFAYWKLEFAPGVLAGPPWGFWATGVVVYAKGCVAGAYWTLLDWVYPVVAGCANDAWGASGACGAYVGRSWGGRSL